MNILDENITRDQVDILQRWGIPVRTISGDLGRQGIDDDQIVPLLLHLKRPTLITRDGDFFARDLIHERYSLVWFNVEIEETAFFVRRFLRHSLFRTAAQRLGKVIRVEPKGIAYWSKDSTNLCEVRW